MVRGYKKALEMSCTYKCKPWEAGHARRLIGTLGGTGLDYMADKTQRHNRKVHYALAIQVRSSDGKHVVEREEIEPSGEEQFAALRWFALHKDD